MSIMRGLMLTAALVALPPLLQAQAPSRGGRAPEAIADSTSANTVTFVLVQSLGVDTAGAIVVRRPTHRPQNIILVTRATTAADLVTAVAILDRSRRAKGDSLSLEMRAIIPRANDASSRRSRNYGQAEANLASLRAAGARRIPGVGTYPAVTATLSSRASR